MNKHSLFASIALLIASPAAAQTAPAINPHQGHDTSQTQNHAGHAQHGQHGQAQGSGQQGQHRGHNMRDGCCADRNNNGRMDCCENMPAGQSCCQQHQARPAQPQAQPNR